MRRINLVVETAGADGLFAYLPDTPIVTYGETLDDIMNNIIQLVDDHNSQNPDDEVEIGELQMEMIIDSNEDDDM